MNLTISECKAQLAALHAKDLLLRQALNKSQCQYEQVVILEQIDAVVRQMEPLLFQTGELVSIPGLSPATRL